MGQQSKKRLENIISLFFLLTKNQGIYPRKYYFGIRNPKKCTATSKMPKLMTDKNFIINASMFRRSTSLLCMWLYYDLLPCIYCTKLSFHFQLQLAVFLSLFADVGCMVAWMSKEAVHVQPLNQYFHY